ncbi:hypothetical protein GWK36_06995 [Caldichromatium japonicum]|uniref:Winged helix-turn helix domain-containing protein n=1 Tax=Caldichromatium japonicum TaxID=2699430 RepID=A0A6G7VCU3_9GAMM|nr:hypothetical protein GWK36_06995 [Caldichromatium japonicum]
MILGCFGIELRPQGEGKYMARWGLTPQKPIRRAYEQSPPAGKTWLEEIYPDIARRAKAEGAEIHWGDETGLRSDEVRGRSYAPAIKTPEIRVTHRREGLSVISTLTNRGKVRKRTNTAADRIFCRLISWPQISKRPFAARSARPQRGAILRSIPL